MKILAVTGPFLPCVGGMQYSTHQTLLGLADKKKGEISLIAPHYPEDRAFDQTQPYRIIRHHGFGYLSAIKRMWLALKLLKKQNYDILFLMGYETELAYGICSLFTKKRKKLIVLAAGTRLQLPNKNPIITFIRNHLICRTYLKSDTVITISDAVKSTILKHTHKGINIVKIPRPIDEDIWCKPPEKKKQNPFHLITTSRIYDQKNIQAVLKIIQRLKAEGYHLKYYIVGGGAYIPKLKLLAKELDIENDVIFMGNLEPEKIVELLKEMHLFILLSIANNGVGETFGRVYLESAAMKVPSIAYKSMGTLESVSDKAGWLFDPGDEDGVFQLLKEILSDRNILEKKSSLAYQWYYDHFRKSIVADRIFNVMFEHE